MDPVPKANASSGGPDLRRRIEYQRIRQAPKLSFLLVFVSFLASRAGGVQETAHRPLPLPLARTTRFRTPTQQTGIPSS